MNLIERLGGYENAKTKIDQINHTLENSELLGGGDAREGLYERLESIDKALLEYRRQHNIFEVGDKVVFIHPFELGDLFTVHSISERFIGVKSNNDECIYYAEIVWGLKHATNEEITAGKRLEVE